MAQAPWKVTIINLGTGFTVFAAEVSAENWLAALRAAREQLGDPGGVPTGASCVVAQSGEVSILDPSHRRRYVLTPAAVATEKGQSRRPPPRPSRAPAAAPVSAAELAARATAARENAREPARASSAAPAAAEAPKVKASEAPPPASAKQVSAAPDAPEARPSARHQQTLAFSPERADAVRREYESSLARATPAAADGDRPSRSNLRALPPLASGPGSSIPPPPKLEHLFGPQRERTPQEATGARLVPAFSRDVDPTPRTPITYRERGYVLTPASDRSNIEPLMQAELLKLRQELRAAPRGQLVHLAAFDKAFRDTPNEPPIATLEWSDWRGNAVFVSNPGLASAPAMHGVSNAADKSFQPPSSGEIPAPGSHVAPIPRAPAEPSPTAAQLASLAAPAENTGTTSAAPAPREPVPASPPPGDEPTSKPAAPKQSALPLKPGKAAWAKLRAATSDASPAGSNRPGASDASAPTHDTAPAVPGASPSPDAAREVSAPLAPSPAAASADAPPLGRASERPAASAGGSPALPWESAPALPAPSPGGAIVIPPAFQTGGQRALREDTGEVDNRLAQAFEALPDLYFLPTPVAGLEFTTQLISRLVPCEAISVCLYDINTDEFRFVAVGGPGAELRRASAVPSQAGLFGAAKWSVEDAFIVREVTRDPRYQPAIDGRADLEILDIAYVPMRKGTQLLGMMQLINSAGDRGFSSADVAVLHYIATQLTEFIATRRSLVD